MAMNTMLHASMMFMVPNSKLPPVEDGTKQMAGTNSYVGIGTVKFVAILQRSLIQTDDRRTIVSTLHH